MEGKNAKVCPVAQRSFGGKNPNSVHFFIPCRVKI